MREKALKILEALGGKDNITYIDGCITRIRATVKDPSLVDERKLKAAGAIGGILKMGTGIQVVVGTYAEIIATEISKIMKEG
ncbi:MAG: PTS glucose/sucrose transporter subunit IIB [Chloroflexi bacterium]|nr:PTS glucose/sucrose transporter subunit IIB [Chloroflexota bacterium]